MEKDQYVVRTINKFVCHYKNGKLHREAGPAIYSLKAKSKYDDLEDKNLYQPSTILPFSIGNLPVSIGLNMGSQKEAYYYIDGVSYTDKEFNSLLEKKDLKIELDTDLNQNNKERSRGIKL